jgi:hypothetical protein
MMFLLFIERDRPDAPWGERRTIPARSDDHRVLSSTVMPRA